MDNAECLGGDVINVNNGYWRSSNDSTKLYKCYMEDACLGGTSASTTSKPYLLYMYILCVL